MDQSYSPWTFLGQNTGGSDTSRHFPTQIELKIPCIAGDSTWLSYQGKPRFSEMDKYWKQVKYFLIEFRLFLEEMEHFYKIYLLSLEQMIYLSRCQIIFVSLSKISVFHLGRFHV